MDFLKITDLAYKQFREFLIEKNVQSSSIRIYLSSMSCHGPVFNIFVDELKEGDLSQKIGDINFIVDKNLFIQYSGFILLCAEENGVGGFTLQPVYMPESTGCSSECSSCSSCQDCD